MTDEQLAKKLGRETLIRQGLETMDGIATSITKGQRFPVLYLGLNLFLAREDVPCNYCRKKVEGDCVTVGSRDDGRVVEFYHWEHIFAANAITRMGEIIYVDSIKAGEIAKA
ncbi:hypothetical protein HYX17_05365 [Candidatus Woesearchaeota archaeon]|nr:hypothetical protein [Candidatus Woesearchaeota archaeon]